MGPGFCSFAAYDINPGIMPLNAQGPRCHHLPYDKHFCVRCRVSVLLHQVVRFSKDTVIMDQDCSNGNLTPCCALQHHSCAIEICLLWLEVCRQRRLSWGDSCPCCSPAGF